jgi:hypothetical protein
MNQEYYNQQYKEVIEYEPVRKPKHRILSIVCGAVATFLDRLIFVIIGIIIGVTPFIIWTILPLFGK